MISDTQLCVGSIGLGFALLFLVRIYPHFNKWRKRRLEMWRAFSEFRRAGWPNVNELLKDINYWKGQFHRATTDEIKKDKQGQLSFFAKENGKPKTYLINYRYEGKQYQLELDGNDWENHKKGYYCVLDKTRRVSWDKVTNKDYVVSHPKLLVKKGEDYKASDIREKVESALVVDRYIWLPEEKAVNKVVVNTLVDMPGQHRELV